MGQCSEAQNEDTRSLAVRYTESGLPQPFSTDYENQFECDLFYAINMLRAKPDTFVRQAKATLYRGHVKQSNVVGECATYLQQMEPIVPLKFDSQCNQAVRANNEAVCAAAEDAPAPGGNLIKMKEQCGGNREPVGTEYSYFKY